MAQPNVSLRDVQVNLRPPDYNLGEVVLNPNWPNQVRTYFADIANPLQPILNYPKAGYAAFTNDGVFINTGTTGYTTAQFVGFCTSKIVGDDRKAPLYETLLGNHFTVPVCVRGQICVYNSTAIVPLIAKGLAVCLSVTPNVTPANVQVGGLVQGTAPAGTTLLDISEFARVRIGNLSVGGGVLIDILKS